MAKKKTKKTSAQSSAKPQPSQVFKDSGERQSFNTGAVRDAQGGKGRFDLSHPFAELLLSRIDEDGARKYDARNWEKGIPISRFIESALRHLAKYRAGLRDEPHLSMALWNIRGALATAAMIHVGVLPQSLFDLPDYTGAVQESALSPHEVESLVTFTGGEIVET